VERQEEMSERNADMPPPTRITYPLRDHLKATRPDGQRPALAMILRSARSGDASKVHQMVKALCDDMDLRHNAGMKGHFMSFWEWPDDYFDMIVNQYEFCKPASPPVLNILNV